VKRRRPNRLETAAFEEVGVRSRGAPRARLRTTKVADTGSRVGDDLVAAFEEMAAHLRGEIELEAHELPGGTMTPARIKAIRARVASSTKEFERVFGIPARTMESYEQGRRKPDGAMRVLLRIIDHDPVAARRALSNAHGGLHTTDDENIRTTSKVVAELSRIRTRSGESDKSLITGRTAASDEPLRLTDKQRWLCERLNQLHATAGRAGDCPSDIFISARHVMHPAHRRGNPDWMAQAAHSLRELLYPFSRSGAEVRSRDAFVRYGAAGDAGVLSKAIGSHYGFMISVAHHEWDQACKNPVLKTFAVPDGTDSETVFERAATAFEDVLFRTLRRQLDVHAEIDRVAFEGISDVGHLRELLAINFDARRYFFAKAPAEHFEKLRDNGLLDPVREIPEDLSKISYRTPELDYLLTAAKQRPEVVADFMLTVPIAPDRFNPEVIDRFLWICQELPAEQLARIVPKLRDETWPRLAARFNFSEFAYRRMFKRLSEAGDQQSTLVLAEAVLALKSREELEKADRRLLFDPLSLKDLEYTGVFESVANVDQAYAEIAFSQVMGVFTSIIELGDTRGSGPFAINEPFSLFHEDLFEIRLGDAESPSQHDSIEDLAAVAVQLLRKTIDQACADQTEVKRIYERNIVQLPDSRTMWSLRLVAVSLCPSALLSELKATLFRIFECEDPYGLTAGAEYTRALKVGFAVLPPEDRAEYFSKVLSLLASEGAGDRDKRIGRNFLSSCYAGLSQEQRSRAEAAFGQPLDSTFSPRPAIQRASGGWVSPKGPVTLKEFGAIAIPDIVEKLKGEWSPARLREQDDAREFLNPLNAEGMGRLLKSDFPLRAQEYLEHADLFFDRDTLHPHYTYSFLSGIDEAIRGQKASAADWIDIVHLMNAITASGRAEPFDRTIDGRESGSFWLAGWDSIYKTIGDLIEALLQGHEDRPLIELAQCRSELLETISQLLAHPDPDVAAEAKSSSDPFTNAINSIRGDGLQALIWFMHREAALLPAEAGGSRVAADVRALYERTLSAEPCMSVVFLFGYHLPTLHAHDRNWAGEVFARLFPEDVKKHDLYLAAWEGYLTQEPFGDLFMALEPYYGRALKLDPVSYTQRRYHTELDKGIAAHLALAFVYAPNFQPDSNLLKLFWLIPNADRHEEFVSFIGRHCILREGEEPWIERSNVGVGRLQAFWDWCLQNVKEEATLAAFGYWMKAESGIFEGKWLATRIRRTLEKTNGITERQHGVLESLQALAGTSPEDVIEAMRFILNPSRTSDPTKRDWIYVDDNLVETFRVLYGNLSTRESTQGLVNRLLPVGNGQYWRLKAAIEN
jgi:putative transcriptional regulator